MKGFHNFLVLFFLFFSSVSVSHSSEWIETKTHNGVTYFLYDSPALVKRYDLTSESFLSDISLSSFDIATALEVDEDGLYIALGRRIARYDHDGGSVVNLANTSSDVDEIVTSSTTIYGHFNSNLISINKDSNSINGSEDYFYTMKGMSFSNVNERLYARTSGISPSDILYIELSSDGSLPTTRFPQEDSPHHGDYPSADETFLFPSETRVVDDAGIIYAANNLTFIASLGGRFQDLTFLGDLPIVLRDGRLVSYSNSLLETGTFVYPTNLDVKRIALWGNNVFGYYIDSNLDLKVIKTAVSVLTPDLPGEPVDPVGLVYSPDRVLSGSDGVVYILSKAHMSIFRWSLIENEYLETIPLVNVPNFMAYSAENNALYIAYESGAINKIALDSEQFQEEAFANLPQRSLGLSTAGKFILAVDPSEGRSHFVYNPDGTLASREGRNYESDEFVWNDANRRMYHFRDNVSPNDLLFEEIDETGVIGEMGDSPFHSSAGIQYPIRVEPNGSVVILGSGRIYDGITLDQVNSLSNNIVDAVWREGELFTLRDNSSITTIQKWDPSSNYNLENQINLNGEPLALLHSDVDGAPIYSIMSSYRGVPVFRNFDSMVFLDTDSDGIADLSDNCLNEPNVSQVDSNNDGVGDACEPLDSSDEILFIMLPILQNLKN